MDIREPQIKTGVNKIKISIMTWLSLASIIVGVLFYFYAIRITESDPQGGMAAYAVWPFAYSAFILSFIFGLLGIFRKESKRVLSILLVLVLAIFYAYTQYVSFDSVIINKAMKKAQETKKLDLRRARLKTVPASIFGVDNLVSIDLSNNYILELPPEIGNLKTLERLDLSNNPIKRLPEEISELDGLVTLLLDFQILEELPTQVAKLKNLRFLTIRSTSDYDAVGLSEFQEFAATLPNVTLVTDGFFNKELIAYSVGKLYSRENSRWTAFVIKQNDDGQYIVRAVGKTWESYGGEILSFEGEIKNLEGSAQIIYKRMVDNLNCDLHFHFNLERIKVSGSYGDHCLEFNSAFYGNYKIKL